MISSCDCDNLIAAQRLRVSKAEQLGPHYFELELRNRRRDRRLPLGDLPRHLGSVLVAVGTRLYGARPAGNFETSGPGPSPRPATE